MRRRLVAFSVVLAFACDAGTTEPRDQDEPVEVPNVTVHAGAAVVTTDTAVLIDGERFFDFGNRPIGIIVNQFTEYTYGGLYEQVNDDLVGESWYMDVGRSIVTDMSGDTVFRRALDFGDVALEGIAARRMEIDSTIVMDAGDHIRVYENYILNRIIIHSHRLNMDGTEVHFADAPFYERMVAGGPLELTASGSADIEPASAYVSLHPDFRITSLWSGESLNFEQTLPMLRTDQQLVVEFNRSLDHSRALLYVEWAPPPSLGVDPEIQQRARAVFRLQASTNRLVIPGAALAEVVSHITVSEGGFVFRIREYYALEDVLEIVRIEGGITEVLSGRQSNGFGLYVRMRR